jgi:hypothetical protein
MARRNLVQFFLVALLLTACGLLISSTRSQGAALIADMTFTGQEFSVQPGSGVAVTDEGLTLALDAFKTVFISPPVKAPFPFNAVIPRWLADVPESANLEIRLRTGKSETEWGEWYDIHAQHDWMLPGEEEVVGELVAVTAVDVTHTHVQYAVTMGRDVSLGRPLLRQLTLTFIDSTTGPTAEELLAAQQARDEALRVEQGAALQTGYPKPTVISRAVWCVEEACNYTEGLEYQRVTHLIVHHTVTNNFAPDWPAVVRAIWKFHTFTRGWGDIGYNFLIDQNGLVYEGHLGGDDVVGTHAAGANAGSMGLALLGTFTDTGIDPPPVMVNKLIDLLAWKADQRSIDVFDASNALPGIRWGLPHLMGHRDVYGTTECPGSRVQAILPYVRDQAAGRIGLVSPHLYVDELSGDFIKSNANWYTGPLSCGHNTHAYYTWSTTDPVLAVNWGEWRPNVPASGRYQIEVYVPYCNTGRPETTGARYTIQHANGTSSVVVDQDARVGLWTSLGEYTLRAGRNTAVRLTDLTTTDDGRGVWFDAIRLLPLQVQPTAVNGAPTGDALLNGRDVLFSWSITHPENVAKTTLEAAVDAGFNTLIHAQEWSTAVTNAIHTFDQDYPDLYWRVLLSAENGEQSASAPTRFTLDATPPVSAVTGLYRLAWNGAYVLRWEGSDAISGVASYTVEYQPQGQVVWLPWLTGVTATSGLFTPIDPAQALAFRVRAVDRAGNAEASRLTPDITTDAAITLTHTIMIPIVRMP